MTNYSTCTQDDVDDGPMTEFNEGFVSYVFGHYCHENPYNGATYEDPHEVERYVMWFGGWQAAKERFPEIEPKEPQ